MCRPRAALTRPEQVDPIVASFTGGAVGVLSMLLLVEVNNAKVCHNSRWL